MKLRKITFGLAVLLAVAAVFAESEPTDDEIESFIREIIKDARTDSQRSSLLMEAVSLAEGNGKLKIALLERSVKYGIKALRTTEDCRKFQAVLVNLVQVDPDRQAHWLAQQAAVLRRWSFLTKSAADKRALAQASVKVLTRAGLASGAKGDWKKASSLLVEAKAAAVAGKLPNVSRLTNYLRTASYLQKTKVKINAHVAALEKSADDLDARSDLIKLLITAMDDPGGAMKYINDDVDEQFRTFTPMAAKDISTLPVEACKNLGDWYFKELSKSSIGVVKFRMLSRAKTYYKGVLKLHTDADVTSATLKLSLARIESDLAKLRGVDPLVCMHCSASGNMPCQACLTNGVATGLRKCYYCKGSARGKCRTCQGQFRLKCSRCSGKGKVYTGTRRSGGVYYKVYAKCSTCRGLGVTHRSSSSYSARPGSCPTCSKLQPESRRGTGPCTYCSGKGGSGTCYTCKGSKTAVCTHCPAGRAISPSRTRSSSTRRPRPPKRPRTSTPSTPTDRSIRKKPKSETGSKSRD